MTFVFDRTIDDVMNAIFLKEFLYNNDISELTESGRLQWMSGLKGCLNATDLNRIENNCVYLSNLLNSWGVPVEIEPIKKWQMEDIPTKTELNRLRLNVATLRALFKFDSSVPRVPNSLEFLDFNRLNNLEYILFRIYDRIMSIITSTDPLGTFKLGKEGKLL